MKQKLLTGSLSVVNLTLTPLYAKEYLKNTDQSLNNRDFVLLIIGLILLAIMIGAILAMKPEEAKPYKRFLVAIFLLGILGYVTYDKNTHSFQLSTFTQIFTNPKDKTEIKNQIEKAYLGLTNGSYMSSNNLNASESPFYNQNISTIYAMGLLPLINLAGIKFEPRNIEVISISGDSAIVNYDVILIKGKEQDAHPINMTVKKIGGIWRLDGSKFLSSKNK